MALTLYELSVPTFLQTTRAMSNILDRATKHCALTGANPDDFVQARLHDDMAPFSFQIEAAWHHSVWGIEALKTGATGVMISNHGGRQLDGAPAPIDQVSRVRDALGDGPDIICDGGVRRGSDLFKALAMGATACSIGRPYIYGLAASGEAGVNRALSILREEFERTMILAGVNDVAQLERRHVRRQRDR